MNTGGNGKRFMSDINVTPFVDVMLVLLIIFMVTVPMMTQGVQVNLPKTTTKYMKTSDEPLMLTINKNKEVYIEDLLVQLPDLETKIFKILENQREKEVLLRADETLPYGYVMDVIARVKKAGIDKLGMVTEPVK
jgi:biopolymer transport protein TolR